MCVAGVSAKEDSQVSRAVVFAPALADLICRHPVDTANAESIRLEYVLCQLANFFLWHLLVERSLRLDVEPHKAILTRDHHHGSSRGMDVVFPLWRRPVSAYKNCDHRENIRTRMCGKSVSTSASMTPHAVGCRESS